MKLKLVAEIEGDTNNEVWSKLLTLFCNACDYKRDYGNNVDWPLLTSEGGFGGNVGTLKTIPLPPLSETLEWYKIEYAAVNDACGRRIREVEKLTARVKELEKQVDRLESELVESTV